MLSGPNSGDPRHLRDGEAQRMQRRLNDHMRGHHIGCGLRCEEYRRTWLALVTAGELTPEDER